MALLRLVIFHPLLAQNVITDKTVTLRSAYTRELVPASSPAKEFARRDWSQGLVPRTVHSKRFEGQVAGTGLNSWD